MVEDYASATAWPVPRQDHRLPIRFVGSGSEYFRIWITNLLLILVSFGFYYPFAKVRRLRYFYGCTELGGHAFAFHGDPWKVFRGHVIVAALLGGYTLLQWLWPDAVAFGILAFVVVWPPLWYASLRFRLANSSWRGLRARFLGTAGGAYSALWPIYAGIGVMFAVGVAVAMVQPHQQAVLGILPLLLSLAMPWVLWRMRRYQHANYAIAGERMRFTVTVPAMYGLFLRAGGLWFLGSLVLVAVSIGLLRVSGVGAGGPPTNAKTWLALLPVLVFLVAFQLLLRPYIAARTQNLVWNGTRSAHLHFVSTLKARRLIGVTLRNWVLMILTLGLYYPFAMVVSTRVRLSAVEVVSSIDPDQLYGSEAAAQAAALGDAGVDALGFDIGL